MFLRNGAPTVSYIRLIKPHNLAAAAGYEITLLGACVMKESSGGGDRHSPRHRFRGSVVCWDILIREFIQEAGVYNVYTPKDPAHLVSLKFKFSASHFRSPADWYPCLLENEGGGVADDLPVTSGIKLKFPCRIIVYLANHLPCRNAIWWSDFHFPARVDEHGSCESV